MVTQTTQSTNWPLESTINNIGAKFRASLRMLGVLHMYKREGKLYTFDVPFQAKISRSGHMMIFVIMKSSLPHGYNVQDLIRAKKRIAAFLGTSIRIVQEKDILAVGCNIRRARPQAKEN